MANKSRWMLLVVSTLVALASLHSQWQRIVHPGADFRSVVLSGRSISAVGSWARWHTSTNLGGPWALTSLGSEDRPATVFYAILSAGEVTYIGGSGGSMLRSIGSDATFRTTGVTSDLETFADLSDSVAAKVLAGTFGEGIIASEDKGLTWTAFGTGSSNPNVTSCSSAPKVGGRHSGASSGGDLRWWSTPLDRWGSNLGSRQSRAHREEHQPTRVFTRWECCCRGERRPLLSFA